MLFKMKFIFDSHLKIRLISPNIFLIELLCITWMVNCYKTHYLEDVSGYLQRGINKEIDPCDDFYEYACGKFIENNEKPDYKYLLYSLTSTELTIHDVIRDIFKRDIDESNKKLYMEQKFYNTCMDTGYSILEGRKLFDKIISEFRNSSWQHVLQFYAREVGETFLFQVKLNKKNLLQIGRPNFAHTNKQTCNITMSKNGIKNEQSVKGINSTKDVCLFTRSVNKLVYGSKPELLVVPIAQLQAMYDKMCSSYTKIEWLQLLQNLAEGSEINFTFFNLLEVDIKYISDLCQLLHSSSVFSIKKYLLHNFLEEMGIAAYIKKVKLTDEKRSFDCIEKIPIKDGVFEEITNSYVSQEMKEMVHKMFNNLKSALQELIENSWMRDFFKNKLLQHQRELNYKYGVIRPSAKTLRDTVSYNFETGPIYLKNQINFKKAQIIRDIKIYEHCKNSQSREKRSILCFGNYLQDEKNICSSHCLEVGLQQLIVFKAYLLENLIFFQPAVLSTTLLFPPFFNISAPIGFNYGRMASLIGHEISHAVGSTTVQNIFTRLPTLKKFFGLGQYEKFKVKVRCFTDQFNKYNINGTFTLDENLADTQGLKLAFKAMNTALAEDNELEKKKLTNFESWNQQKLFFLSFANIWCSNPEKREYYEGEKHSPNVFRVIGTLRNMDEFAETFNCTKNQYMYSKRKCDFWSTHSDFYDKFNYFFNL